MNPTKAARIIRAAFVHEDTFTIDERLECLEFVLTSATLPAAGRGGTAKQAVQEVMGGVGRLEQ